MATRNVPRGRTSRNAAQELRETGMGDLTLRWLASQLGPDWEKVASSLGFSSSKIGTFKLDNPLQTEEQAFQALVRWGQRQPRGADLTSAVCSALWEAGRVDLADQLRERKRKQEPCCQGPRTSVGPRCVTHPGEVTQFFCETCFVSICHLCTVGDHCKSKHDIAHIGAAAHKYRQVLREIMLPELRMEIEELKRSLDEICRAKQIFVKTFAKTKNELLQNFRQAAPEDTLEVQRMEDDMRDLRRQRDRDFYQLETQVCDLLRRKQELLATAFEISNNTPNDSDFLAVYPWIRQRLESLSSQRAPEVEPGLLCLQRFRSNPCATHPGPGTLDLGGTWELRGEFGRQGRHHRGVAMLSSREIVVADHFNKRVIVCDTKGQPQRVIPLPGNPYDVAASPASNCIVVVDSTKNVRVFSKNNRLQAEFPTVPQTEVNQTEVDLRSVAVKPNGAIIVGDIKRKVWTEHCPEGVLGRTVQVKTKPYFLAVDNSERVVVSGLVRKARVLETKGNTVFTIKPTIEGELVKQLTGVCSTGSGIFMAMNNGVENTGHIHHYDERGAFLGCLARGLRLPLGVASTAQGRQLAVADWTGSVKLYKFKV